MHYFGVATPCLADGGWLAPLTDSLEAGLRFLQAGLDALHVPYSYGYSIILLTLAVKLATFPLTKQQVESQLAVQSLKPRIDLIKARYGEDKDRVSKETSLLYEQAGVNPLAGCLPTLATIPIFIGLYRSLTNVANAGLLEDQGFYWIPSLAGPTDLAHRGTAWLFPFVDGAPPIGWEQGLAYASLPALLVVAQYISSAVISPPVDPADPNANTTKVVSALAPWMVAYFALNVPAGLGLYYLTNTVLTLAVQLYLRKLGGAKAMTKPGSGRRTGLEAGSFVRWQSATAAAVAAQKAAELARDEDEADTSALAAVAARKTGASGMATPGVAAGTGVDEVAKLGGCERDMYIKRAGASACGWIECIVLLGNVFSSKAAAGSGELRAAHIASVHASAGPSVPPAKQREERRAEWNTQRRQVIKVPGGAVLRGCKKTRRKLLAHFQLRAGIHSQLRVIASLYVLRIFLTCLVGYRTPGYPNAPTPPAVQPPRALDAAPLPPLPLRAPAQPASMDMDWEPEPDPDPEPEPELEPAPAPPTLRPPSARLAARHPPPAAPTGPPMPLDSEDPVLLQQLKVFCLYFANSNFLTPYVSHHVFALCAYLQLEEGMAEVSMERHGHAKQLVVFFGAATIGTGGGWGADAVLRACRKVVCRPRGTDQRRGRVVLVDEHRTSRVSSAVNGQQPLAPRKPPQSPRSSQAATQAAASEPGPSTPLPAKRSKRTKAEPEAAEPTKGKGKAAKAKPAPQPGRWLDRDCKAALNMQRIGESKWRPLELCWWPEQTALPAKGKEYPGLGYKRLRDKPPKEQQQQQPAEAQ
ncbi:hypothetical protein QJQ45_019304 [Haematococcus lacustris]|nr:hypothetical protein QJQ45_019304 [Haematococcus lacustris]